MAGTTQPPMEEQKQQGDLNTLQGEAVGVTVAVALQQPVPLELWQIVAELVELSERWKVVRTALWISFAVHPLSWVLPR